MRIFNAMWGIGVMTEAEVDGLKIWPPYAEWAIPTFSRSGSTTRTPESSTSRQQVVKECTEYSQHAYRLPSIDDDSFPYKGKGTVIMEEDPKQTLPVVKKVSLKSWEF